MAENPVKMATPPSPLVFTQSAAQRVYELLKEEGDFSLKLRVYIEGGGCSGFQYGFTFDETVNEGDTVIRKQLKENEEEDDDGEGRIVELVIDPMSYQYLMSAEIDYVSDLQGERFIIRNPNASTTCGCGSSFSVD